MHMGEYHDYDKKQLHKELENPFKCPSTITPGLSIAAILSCICDKKALSVLKAIKLSENNDMDILITKLGLTRRQFYSSIEKLMDYGLVKRIKSKYRLTSFGKVVFNAEQKVETEIETAIKNYWKLKAVDSIIMGNKNISANDDNKQLLLQECQKIIDGLIDDNELKDILLSKEGSNLHSKAAAKAGFIAVRRSLLTKVINDLSEQEIISLAEHVAKTINEDDTLFLKKEYIIKSVLDLIERWIKISGYPYRHEVSKDSQNKHLYVIQHNMGIKWSIYLANLYQFLFDELEQSKIRIEFDKTENMLAFTIDGNDNNYLPAKSNNNNQNQYFKIKMG
jgi:predicted transcriptional regulator